MSDTATIKQRRLDRHMSIRALAKAAGIGVGTLRRIESGDAEPFEHTLRKVEDTLASIPVPSPSTVESDAAEVGAS